MDSLSSEEPETSRLKHKVKEPETPQSNEQDTTQDDLEPELAGLLDDHDTIPGYNAVEDRGGITAESVPKDNTSSDELTREYIVKHAKTPLIPETPAPVPYLSPHTSKQSIIFQKGNCQIDTLPFLDLLKSWTSNCLSLES